jgi:DUF4097 and DUF4098 domain-containing protein YvlB
MSRMKRTFFLLSGVALVVPYTTGCRLLFRGFGQEQASVTESHRFSIKPGAQVVIATHNGDVQVEGTADGKEVEIELTKTAWAATVGDAERNAKQVQVLFDESEAGLRIIAEESTVIENTGVSLKLKVPADVLLDVESSNGNIIARGMQAGAELSSSNGDLQCTDMAPPLIAESSNGNIEWITSDGDPSPGASPLPIAIKSSNGNIIVRGSFPVGEHTIESSNGSIDCYIPDESSIVLRAETSNGSVTSQLPNKDTNEDEAIFEGTIGDSASSKTKVTLETSNGNIAIRSQR